MRPLLAATDDGAEHRISELRDLLADEFGLTAEERAERIPSGRVTRLQSRVGWAATYLYRCGLLDRPRRAHYRITERGRQVLADHPERVDLNVLQQFEELAEFRSRAAKKVWETRRKSGADGAPVAEGTATPEEKMEAAYLELRAALVDELLDRVREQSWQFFERLVLDVLQAAAMAGRMEPPSTWVVAAMRESTA